MKRLCAVLLVVASASPAAAASYEPWSLIEITKCAVDATGEVVNGGDPDLACLD